MSDPSPRMPLAGGFPIAAGVLAGSIIGFLLGEPTIGFFLGLVSGVFVSVVVWKRGS